MLLSGDSDVSRGSASAGGLGIAVTSITFVALSLVQISIRTTISCLSFSLWDGPSTSALVVMETMV